MDYQVKLNLVPLDTARNTPVYDPWEWRGIWIVGYGIGWESRSKGSRPNSASPSKDEAQARALDALLSLFDALIADKRDIPAPSTPARGALTVTVPATEAAKVAL